MKKLFIIILITFGASTMNLFAQPDFTFSGGINFGMIGFDSGFRDVSMKPGPTFSIEILKGPIIIGAAYVKRGGNWEISSSDYKESISLDYLTGYVLFHIPIVKNLSGLFGCQFGECMGGTINFEQNDEVGSIIIYTDAFNVDFGLIFGVDYMFNSRIGTRASYYAGSTGVFISEMPYNFTNSGIGIYLLLKI